MCWYTFTSSSTTNTCTMASSVAAPLQPTRTHRLGGKVAIITGGSLGIGYGMALRFAEEGAAVVVTSRKQANVDSAVAAIRKAVPAARLLGVTCHVGKASDRAALLAKTVATFKRIDILVNNVAVSPYMGPTLDTPEAAIDKIFSTNVKAPFLFTKEALPHMSPGASVLFVSSIGAYLPFGMLGFYSVSKTALTALTKLLAQELAHEGGIRCNCIAPGIVKTRFSKPFWSTSEMSEAANDRAFLGRTGDLQDCAGMAAFLSSDDASWITGETFIVAGGTPSRL